MKEENIIIEAFKRAFKLDFQKRNFGVSSFFIGFISFIFLISGLLDSYKIISGTFPFLSPFLKPIPLFFIFVIVSFLSTIFGTIYYAVKIIQEREKETQERNKLIEQNLYRFLESTLHVTVYENGHGIIQCRSEIESLSDKFKYIEGYFALDSKCEKKGLTLKDLEKFKSSIQKNIRNRFNDQTIFVKIISINGKTVAIGEEKKIEINKDEKIGVDSRKRMDFKIEFPSEIKNLNEEIMKFHEKSKMKYMIGWSSPNLFVTEKSQIENNLEGDEEWIWGVIHPIKDLNLVVSFEYGIRIKEIFLLRNGEKIGEFKRDDDLYYTKYIYEDICPSINDKYIIRWSYLESEKGRRSKM